MSDRGSAHNQSPRPRRPQTERRRERNIRPSANSATQSSNGRGNGNDHIEERIYVAPRFFGPRNTVEVTNTRSQRGSSPDRHHRRCRSAPQRISNSQPPCDHSGFPTLETMMIFHPPPIDEDTRTNDSPPYQPTLHRYLDLMSFDPRYAPVLRINKRLIDSSNKLKESITYFKSSNLIPDKVNLWDIQHVDDSHFDDVIPEIIMSSHPGPSSARRRPSYVQRNSLPTVRHTNVLEDDEEQLSYALFLSTLEANSQRRTNYSGFRYQNPVTY